MKKENGVILNSRGKPVDTRGIDFSYIGPNRREYEGTDARQNERFPKKKEKLTLSEIIRRRSEMRRRVIMVSTTNYIAGRTVIRQLSQPVSATAGDYDKALKHLKSYVPYGYNAIIGLRVAGRSDFDGLFTDITLVGTAVYVE